MGMKTPKLGDYAASSNDELLAAAKADGDALHCEMAHRIRILIKQSEGRESELVLCPVLPECPECGGKHERSGARTDCIRHWQYRARAAENKLLVKKVK